MSTFSESSSFIVGSAAELAKLLAEERAKNRQLQQQLDMERQERSRAEALLFKGSSGRQPAIGEESDSGSDKGKGGSDDSPTAATAKVRVQERRLKRDKEVLKQQIKQLQGELRLLQLSQERVVQQVEQEEEMLSNNLLRKLRLVVREKEQLQLELSRSSRSSSLDHSCDSSVAGSMTSEQHSLRDTADTRSEISTLACCSESSSVWDDAANAKSKIDFPRPPPPVEVGER
jgi:hypothetical protein